MTRKLTHNPSKIVKKVLDKMIRGSSTSMRKSLLVWKLATVKDITKTGRQNHGISKFSTFMEKKMNSARRSAISKLAEGVSLTKM